MQVDTYQECLHAMWANTKQGQAVITAALNALFVIKAGCP